MKTKSPQLSAALLDSAESRLQSPKHEADLRRATSDLYYALFHRVCEGLVEPFSSYSVTPAYRDAYLSLYRSVDHNYVAKRCKDARKLDTYPRECSQFAATFVSMKNKRETADYDPLAKFSLSSVNNDAAITKTVLSQINAVEAADIVPFFYFLGFKGARGRDD